jgi:uncharacterized protein YndB with AHSA1/START domain
MDVRRELIVDSDPDRVWEALTDPALLERWLAEEVELEPHEGGRVTARDRDGRGRTGVVEHVEPPRTLVLRWRDDEGTESTVAINVDAVARGSLVTVVETAAWTPAAAALASVAWGMRLSLAARAACAAALV